MNALEILGLLFIIIGFLTVPTVLVNNPCLKAGVSLLNYDD